MSSEWRRDPATTNPTGHGWILEQFREIKAQLRALAARASINNATLTGLLRILGNVIISGVGRLTFTNGGSILARDHQGREYFYVGGFDNVGFGVALYRLNGTAAFLLIDDDDLTEQVQRIRMMDRNARLIFAEDPSGEGLSWPLLPFTTYCDDFRQWGGTTSGTFASVAGAQGYKMSPRVYVRVKHTTDAGGTTGELRLTINGTQVGSTIPVGFVLSTAEFGPAVVPGVTGDLVDIRVECRRTAGTGEVRAEILLCQARES